MATNSRLSNDQNAQLLTILKTMGAQLVKQHNDEQIAEHIGALMGRTLTAWNISAARLKLSRKGVPGLRRRVQHSRPAPAPTPAPLPELTLGQKKGPRPRGEYHPETARAFSNRLARAETRLNQHAQVKHLTRSDIVDAITRVTRPADTDERIASLRTQINDTQDADRALSARVAKLEQDNNKALSARLAELEQTNQRLVTLLGQLYSPEELEAADLV